MRGREQEGGKAGRIRGDRRASTPSRLPAFLFIPLVACASARVPDPRAAARAYAEAAERGDVDALYAMMTTSSKQAKSKQELEAMIAGERGELAEQGKALLGPDVRVEATARLRFADGEEAALELRGGQYWITAAGALPGGASTPEEALEQLRRVLARRSYAGLMRVLSPATRAAIESDLRTLVDGLDRPETLPVQITGDSATIDVPGGHQVKLKREAGIWRVEDFD
jgi:hypothetical protein